MGKLTERQMALKRARLYVMVDDLVRPKRRWLLRRGMDDLIHWALEHEDDSATTVPWCYTQTGSRLVVFFRRAERHAAPTCVRCALPGVKPVRLTEREIRRFKS